MEADLEGGPATLWQDARQAQGGMTPGPGGRCARRGGAAVGEVEGGQQVTRVPGHSQVIRRLSARQDRWTPPPSQGNCGPHIGGCRLGRKRKRFNSRVGGLESRKIIKIVPFLGPVSPRPPWHRSRRRSCLFPAPSSSSLVRWLSEDEFMWVSYSVFITRWHLPRSQEVGT